MLVKMLLAGVFSEMGAFMHHKNIKNVTQRKTPPLSLFTPILLSLHRSRRFIFAIEGALYRLRYRSYIRVSFANSHIHLREENIFLKHPYTLK